MLPTLSPQEFVDKWRKATLKERSAAQEHFIDLCRLVGHPTPAEADPTGESFTFEAGASKQRGGAGLGRRLEKGLLRLGVQGQARQPGQGLPAAAPVPRIAARIRRCWSSRDIDRIVIHTNFTNTVKQVIELTLDDLLRPGQPGAAARRVLSSPKRFRAPQTTEQVTGRRPREFARLADLLRKHRRRRRSAAPTS